MNKTPLCAPKNYQEEIPSDSNPEKTFADIPVTHLVDGHSNHRPSLIFDIVEKPKHYNEHHVESIDIIKLVAKDAPTGFAGYLIGNITKYIWRCWYKGHALEDLKKARWYLERLIKHLENQNDSH